ncbi:hypothetical protein BO94DRAFT_531162 [Aspergillus sclerotioniger CBS 115572]|uniref:Uncharacterized protein n=1 Tax=Aspergillus sclerotioniger CBS 115572 TaxID=1450535 RepID=A0A317XAN3_9EURO|nr:hypothetical protein BO94DRAFT_531162 [Aspergillus sclerotioniger CBS 115572]PWY95241.1 hypothetical protein BO94DRAFT_531162 [Aspergillus sclerotioniger CBS 115572]
MERNGRGGEEKGFATPLDTSPAADHWTAQPGLVASPPIATIQQFPFTFPPNIPGTM